MSGWLGEGDVSKKKKEREINKKWAKTWHSKPEGSGANHKWANHRKTRKDEAQGTKGNVNKKLHKTPKGEEIYICKIYIKKRIYGYISRGYIFNVGDVAYLLGNLNERFLQKQKRDKERKRNKRICIKT